MYTQLVSISTIWMVLVLSTREPSSLTNFTEVMDEEGNLPDCRNKFPLRIIDMDAISSTMATGMCPNIPWGLGMGTAKQGLRYPRKPRGEEQTPVKPSPMTGYHRLPPAPAILYNTKEMYSMRKYGDTMAVNTTLYVAHNHTWGDQIETDCGRPQFDGLDTECVMLIVTHLAHLIISRKNFWKAGLNTCLQKLKPNTGDKDCKVQIASEADMCTPKKRKRRRKMKPRKRNAPDAAPVADSSCQSEDRNIENGKDKVIHNVDEFKCGKMYKEAGDNGDYSEDEWTLVCRKANKLKKKKSKEAKAAEKCWHESPADEKKNAETRKGRRKRRRRSYQSRNRENTHGEERYS